MKWRRSAKRSDERPRILLPEGSSTSARQTLYGLGGRCVIDILDPSPWCQCRFSSFVRRWRRCPSLAKDPAGYLVRLADVLRRERYDVLFPTHEQVYLLARFRDALSCRAGLALPEFDSLRRLQNKAEFARLLDELSLPAPETVVVGSQSELESLSRFPCYLKLPHSTAGYGVRLVNDPDGLRRVVREFKDAGEWSDGSLMVVQQPAEGVQSVANAVFQEGRLLAAHCAEIRATGIGGGPTVRVSAAHPIVVEHVRQLGEHLGWHGPMFLDYFYDPATQRPQYIEGNPRIGETVNALLSGVNLCELLVEVSLGRQVDAVQPGRAGVWSHTGFIILLSAAFEGASRRELIRELWRAWTGQGYYGVGENEMTRLREDWGSLIPAVAASLRLLALPRSAYRLSKNTVDNYSLPETAVSAISDLPADFLAGRLSS